MTIARRAVAEGLLVVGLFAFGTSVGAFVSRRSVQQPLYYQAEFGPSVMVAVGRGFVNPVASPGSPLAEFLAVQRAALEPGDALSVATVDVDQFQHATRYLMLVVGYTWRVAGISWHAVGIVMAVLCGLTVVAAYAFCRAWLSAPLSAIGALLMCVSPLHLQYVLQLRDYSKAPFVLFALALSAAIALKPLLRRALVLCAAVCGAVIGIGIGFRMDVLAMAPIALASLVLFRARRPWTGLADKAMAAGALAAALVVTAAPMFFHLGSKGSNGFHVIVLGYADPFDNDLGLTRPAYSVVPVYDDSYVASVLGEYGRRRTGVAPGLSSAPYDVAGRQYWMSILRHFPADVVTRALGAAASVLNQPFDNPSLSFLKSAPEGDNRLLALLTNQPPHRWRIDVVFDWLSSLKGWGVLFAAVFVGASAARRIRNGVFAAWILLVTAAYASLQFADRHVFHLEIFAFLAMLVSVSVLVRTRVIDWRAISRGLGTVVALAAIIGLSATVLRVYQTVHLRRLFDGYIAAARQPVTSALADTGHGTWRARLALPKPLVDGHRLAEYYIVEFDGTPGTTKMSAVGVHYETQDGAHNYSRIMPITETAGVNRMFVPAYGRFPTFAFDGLEITADMKSRLRGIYRVERSAQPDMLLSLRLPGDWDRHALYQSLRAEGARQDPEVVAGAGGTIGHLAWLNRLDSPETTPSASKVTTLYTSAARIENHQIEMDGPAESQSAYVMEFQPVDVVLPAALLVRGHLDEGGMTIGLLQDRRWAQTVMITQPGDFVAVIDIGAPGAFTPVITNATRRNRALNRFVIDRFGIVSGEAR